MRAKFIKQLEKNEDFKVKTFDIHDQKNINGVPNKADFKKIRTISTLDIKAAFKKNVTNVDFK